MNERLGKVWSRVERELAAHWSAARLARLAHCSTEHLRRRTPIQQVTYMRVQHAAALLQKEDAKLATIATAVGYSDAFVPSKIFRKWIGSTPSD